MSSRRRARTGKGDAIPADYDSDPGRFAANQAATRRFAVEGDVHPVVARRLAAEGARTVLDIGGGNGLLAGHLSRKGVGTVVVDRAGYVIHAPCPAVLGDALRLPFRDGTFDGAAALWMLYHLADPVHALLEAHRVLRSGGLLAVSTVSRHNDPELAPVLPDWGKPLSFDAENAPEQLSRVFDLVDVQSWDRPMVHLADHAAATLFLRGRGLSEQEAPHAAQRLKTPVTLTKRGMIGWARKR
ncbi:class I SAM-dependent methyltransferase [Streptomyces sp. NRRL S-1448]|uniref:class I SAM-dependent methyltransferase n=1 Tax=Streptomyces sp. NRRL S-1448 TaxID=1463883 RepID=UPI000D13F526|nr:class I SAM-dependent methyltransferase [Streptomyces sp. NRRL S-1448]